MVQVTMACGCRLALSGGIDEPPLCATHDERRVQAVTAPPPRIRAVECDGALMGPLVTKG